MTTVSIIIPVYNDEQYVAEAIESALAQTLKEVEVIVVDDGSTDATPQVISQYEGRVVHIRQENRGCPAAINTGIRASRGRYVCFLGSDDMFPPDKAEVQAAFLDKHPDVGLCCGAYQTVDETGQHFSKTIERRLPENLLERLAFGPPFPANAPLIRREWLEKTGGLDERMKSAEDWDLWCRLYAAGCKFWWVDELVAVVRIRRGSKSKDPEFVHPHRMSVLDNYFSALGPRAPESLEPIARSRVWLRTGAGRLRLGRRDAAKAAWAAALEWDENVLSALGSWVEVLRHLDPNYPFHHPNGLPNYRRTCKALRSLLLEMSVHELSLRGNKRLREQSSYLALALSRLAFFRRRGWLARRWLLRAIIFSPLLRMCRGNWRLASKLILGPNLSSLLSGLKSMAKAVEKTEKSIEERSESAEGKEQEVPQKG